MRVSETGETEGETEIETGLEGEIEVSETGETEIKGSQRSRSKTGEIETESFRNRRNWRRSRSKLNSENNLFTRVFNVEGQWDTLELDYKEDTDTSRIL